MAAGMAAQGLDPGRRRSIQRFCSAPTTRLLHDVAICRQLHVVFWQSTAAGIVGADGDDASTACSTLRYLRLDAGHEDSLPRRASPSCASDAARARSIACNGPVAIRYPRGGEGCIARRHCRLSRIALCPADVPVMHGHARHARHYDKRNACGGGYQLESRGAPHAGLQGKRTESGARACACGAGRMRFPVCASSWRTRSTTAAWANGLPDRTAVRQNAVHQHGQPLPAARQRDRSVTVTAVWTRTALRNL